MMGYINKEDAVRILRVDCVNKYPLSYLLGIGAAAKAIEDAPTADVEEVRHGEWVVCGTFDYFLKCSLCESEKYPMSQVCNHKYCPNCGAKMDGERSEK